MGSKPWSTARPSVSHFTGTTSNHKNNSASYVPIPNVRTFWPKLVRKMQSFNGFSPNAYLWTSYQGLQLPLENKKTHRRRLLPYPLNNSSKVHSKRECNDTRYLYDSTNGLRTIRITIRITISRITISAQETMNHEEPRGTRLLSIRA